MTLQIELSPAEEKQLLSTAARDGVPVSEAAHRIIRSYLRQTFIAEQRTVLEEKAAQSFAASGETEEEMETYIQQTVNQVRAERRAQQNHER